MAKLKLTKNELKKQKDALKRYRQYLPTLVLKKQQLQSELVKIHNSIEELKKRRAYIKAVVYKWTDVFSEKSGIEKFLRLERLEVSSGNIAGTDVPVYEKTVFHEDEYDYTKVPLWVDYGIEALKDVMILNSKMEILQEQNDLLMEELRITTQRVNLFEKIMIPQAEANIGKIEIYLGDLETAAVVTGKIAKEKILRTGASLGIG
ncbi:MAG: V-type ATP synthase subunit D [Candidatus Omnitrophota bacterium]